MTNDPSQSEYWNGAAGETWAAWQETLDRVLAPFGRKAMERANVQPGERVLDVGCGCGGTSRELASAVGPSGAVHGVDVSGPMLARARSLSSALPQLSFTQADASTARFESPSDVLFSRFGVMFFEHPVQAFKNLHAALRPGGRVSFVCWQPAKLNAWVTVPLTAALTVLPPPEPPTPRAPGPFAFAEPEYVQSILTDAGFHAVDIAPFEQPMQLSVDTLENGVEYAMQIGPTARMAASADPSTRARVRDAVRKALEPYANEHGVALGARTWSVTATRP